MIDSGVGPWTYETRSRRYQHNLDHRHGSNPLRGFARRVIDTMNSVRQVDIPLSYLMNVVISQFNMVPVRLVIDLKMANDSQRIRRRLNDTTIAVRRWQ